MILIINWYYIYILLFIIFYLLFIIYYLLFFILYLLIIIYYLLFIIYYLLFRLCWSGAFFPTHICYLLFSQRPCWSDTFFPTQSTYSNICLGLSEALLWPDRGRVVEIKTCLTTITLPIAVSPDNKEWHGKAFAFVVLN